MTTVNTSTASFYQQSIAQMTSLRGQTQTMQTQIATGNRIIRASDDPIAAEQMRALQRKDALASVDQSNASTATTNLQLADGALSTLTTYIGQALSLAEQAANGTYDPQQRAQMGQQLQAIHDNVFQLANSLDSSGNALFGGQSAAAAYTLDASGYPTYLGSATANVVQLGDGATVNGGVTGPEVFNFSVNGTPTDLMTVLQNLATSLQSGSATGQADAQASIDGLNAGLNQASTAQTIVGSREAWITFTNSQNTNASQFRAQREADVGGTDLTTTVANLQEAMTVLEASQASFTKISSLSLFNYLS